MTYVWLRERVSLPLITGMFGKSSKRMMSVCTTRYLPPNNITVWYFNPKSFSWTDRFTQYVCVHRWCNLKTSRCSNQLQKYLNLPLLTLTFLGIIAGFIWLWGMFWGVRNSPVKSRINKCKAINGTYNSSVLLCMSFVTWSRTWPKLTFPWAGPLENLMRPVRLPGGRGTEDREEMERGEGCLRKCWDKRGRNYGRELIKLTWCQRKPFSWAASHGAEWNRQTSSTSAGNGCKATAAALQ